MEFKLKFEERMMLETEEALRSNFSLDNEERASSADVIARWIPPGVPTLLAACFAEYTKMRHLADGRLRLGGPEGKC